ncbi:SRPBCC domain-containing protein [Carnobacterium gallinarum]|uniref:SRPBCC family protein n=1 Tax=Carnobacterium gallinarum TaxID=2749 RepID=UPI00054F7A5C|nr:SRPBCC family protein [Carnobacterium gallinarum]
MSVETYQITIKSPIETIWSFIQAPENWLPLLPGYLSLKKLEATHYYTKLHLAIGPIDRDVELSFTINDSKTTNQTIEFSFHSTTDKVTGYGSLNCFSNNSTETQVQLAIEIKLSGKSGLLFKPALTKLKLSWSQETLEKMRELF